MKTRMFVGWMSILAVSLFVSVPLSWAEGMKGRIGVGGFGAQAVPVGMSRLLDQADVGSDFGGTVRYGLDTNWAVGASYENIYLQKGIRREPLTLSALYYHTPDKSWTPVGEFGLGAASSNPGGPFTNFSMKAGIGVEFFLTRWFSLGPQLNFHFISHSGDAPAQAMVMSPGVIAMFYFGGSDEKSQPAPQPAAAAPVAVPVALALVPAQTTLGPGQSQAFHASMGGQGNTSAAWTIDPPLGTISDAGLYQAPATVSFAQSVRVTAVNRADASKSATAVVQLQPPSAAPQEVSIQLNVLFDTGKDTIKPDFDRELKKLADFLKSYPNTHAQIEGHTDNTGDAGYNKSLSQKRADSVKNALVSRLGIDASRLSAVGYGQEKPIADNQTASGRAQNRRVVAVVKSTVQP